MVSVKKKSKRAKGTGSPILDMFTVPAPSKKKKQTKPKKKKVTGLTKKPKVDPVPIVEHFATYAENHETAPIYIGIDPGSTGALAFVCRKRYCVVDIPVLCTFVKKTRRTTYKVRKATGKKTRTLIGTQRDFDYATICAIFRLFRHMKKRVHILLERIPPTIGPGRKYAEIMLNRAYMMWPLFLHSKGYDVHQESPGVWKLEMQLLGKDKEASRRKALRLFPDADILRKKDHDRAEALLLSAYLRRKLQTDV